MIQYVHKLCECLCFCAPVHADVYFWRGSARFGLAWYNCVLWTLWCWCWCSGVVYFVMLLLLLLFYYTSLVADTYTIKTHAYTQYAFIALVSTLLMGFFFLLASHFWWWRCCYYYNISLHPLSDIHYYVSRIFSVFDICCQGSVL